LKIALVGYGKMGKTIEKIAVEKGHKISFKISSNNKNDINNINPENTDIAIEFSVPEIAPKNLITLINNKIPVVCGTTAWLDKWDAVEEAVIVQNVGFIYASNFSIGVNIFFSLNSYLSKMLSKVSGYDAAIEEIHHLQKVDAPSGTAISLAHGIIKNHQNYDKWHLKGSEESDGLEINALRKANVPGTHTVKWENDIDTIEIKHTAKSRLGFASGAVLAAEWLQGKHGIFSMNDVLNINQF
jgi:4-hydroxy-tetrahydrodipicolinate reductase